METVVHVAPSSSPASRPETGMSRYFSATSTVLGTRAVSQTKRNASEQLNRAIANGAARYNTRGVSEQHIRPSTPNRGVENENDFPLTPVTVTQVAKDYCPHKIARMQVERNDSMVMTPSRRSARRWQLDGSSPPPTTSDLAPRTSLSFQNRPLPALPPAPATRASISPSGNSPNAVIANDFAHRALEIRQSALSLDERSVEAPSSRRHAHITNHRHHPAYGTWRTRMKRTRC